MEDIIINKVQFVPHQWHFSNDGIWGHIYFLVKKDIFQHHSNNGAHCYPYEYYESDSYTNQRLEKKINSSYDLVHMSTPCIEHGENLHKYTLEEILNMTAQEIYANLK